jgi:hypothetical protein
VFLSGIGLLIAEDHPCGVDGRLRRRDSFMSSSNARSFPASLMALSIAATLARLQCSHASPSITEVELETFVGQASVATRRAEESQREVDRITAAINRISEMGWCLDSPIAFLGGSERGVIPHAIGIMIASPHGERHFGFAAGTPLQQVVDTVNDFPYQIGVFASIETANPDRVQFRATTSVDMPFIRLKQTSGTLPSVYSHLVGGFGMLDWIDYGCTVGVPACAESAILYLSTGWTLDTDGKGPVTILVQSVEHFSVDAFTFASGTSASSIIAAINSFHDDLGVTAAFSDEPPYRLELRSFVVGDEAKVQIQQVGGLPPMIFAQPVGGIPSYDLTDFGRDRTPGDVDCDRTVGASDIAQVVNVWGACPPTPASCPADLDANEVVNIDDLLNVINHWGQGDQI